MKIIFVERSMSYNKHTNRKTNMKIDVREIIFIKQNAPTGLMKMVANNTDISYQKVRRELMTLKKDYNEEIIIEVRRLLKETTGLVYHEEAHA